MRWLFFVAPAIGVLLFLGAQGPANVEAQAATDTPTPVPTGTPTYVWSVAHATPGARCHAVPTNNINCLHIDPIGRRFVYYPDPASGNASPVAADVKDMQVSQQHVAWKYTSGDRKTMIWASVDRVRATVRMTLWRREPSRAIQTQLFRSGTPLLLPKPAQPAIEIQDFRFVPRRIVIGATQRVTFQNSSRVQHRIVFDRSPGVDPTDPADPDRAFTRDFGSDLTAGRIATPYPLLRGATPMPDPVTTPEPLSIWQPGTYTYSCQIHTYMRGVIVVPEGS